MSELQHRCQDRGSCTKAQLCFPTAYAERSADRVVSGWHVWDLTRNGLVVQKQTGGQRAAEGWWKESVSERGRERAEPVEISQMRWPLHHLTHPLRFVIIHSFWPLHSMEKNHLKILGSRSRTGSSTRSK